MATALSLVLDVRIYQDSLRRAAQSAATEVAKPLSPPAMPQANEPQEKGALIGELSKPERAASPPSKKDRPSDIAHDSLKQQSRKTNF